jgi:hypothetical protein
MDYRLTNSTDWPQRSAAHCIIDHMRTWACWWICDGHNRRTGQIAVIDALRGEIERLREGRGT